MRAIGETGLDFYRDTAAPDDQRRAFAAQIEIARELGMPLVIHARDAEGESAATDEIFATLDQRAAGVTVILHCFSAPQRVADAAERGWYCSFAGNVTYPRSEELREAAAQVPEDRILVETDAPFLAPQEMRGKRNEPAYVTATAAAASPSVRGVSYEELEATVEANARRALRLVAAGGRWSGWARTSSPIRTCSTRSSATPSWRRTTSCSRSAPGKGC